MKTKQKKLSNKLINIRNRIDSKKYKDNTELRILLHKDYLLLEKIKKEADILIKYAEYNNLTQDELQELINKI